MSGWNVARVVLFMGTVLWAGCRDQPPAPAVESQSELRPVRMRIHDPAGAIEVSALHASRLTTLETGRTVCALSDHMWQADALLGALVSELGTTGATIVGFDEFPDVYRTPPETVVDAVVQRGCDAAVVAAAG